MLRKPGISGGIGFRGKSLTRSKSGEEDKNIKKNWSMQGVHMARPRERKDIKIT